MPARSRQARPIRWVASLPTRRRKPVKPATVFAWQHALDKWVLPSLGDKFLGDISNGALRDLVEKMAAAGLSAKTIVNYSQVVKLVVASAVDSDGEQIYPRKWNHDFIGLPIVKKENQHRPTVTESNSVKSWRARKSGMQLFSRCLREPGCESEKHWL
jgi:hypothetical protein